MTGQAALEITAGAVFVDETGELTRLRDALEWYPDDLWRHVIACDWQRLDQELPLMSRAGERGDDLGSRVVAARLVDVAMHLGYVLSRTWAPYSKWRGTLFGALPGTAAIANELATVLAADHWQGRQDALGAALTHLGDLQERAGLPGARPIVETFWDRPFLHIAPQLQTTLRDGIVDPRVRALTHGVGSIEQLTDTVDVLVRPSRRRALVAATLAAT